MVILGDSMYSIFKRLFGEQTKKILVNFVNSELSFQEGKKVVNITITYLCTDIDGIYVRIDCVDQRENTYMINVTYKWIDFLKKNASILDITRDELVYLNALKLI